VAGAHARDLLASWHRRAGARAGQARDRANLWAQGRRAARIPLGDIGRESESLSVSFSSSPGRQRAAAGRGASRSGHGRAMEHGAGRPCAGSRSRQGRRSNNPTARTREITAAWIGGCDGAHSAVRGLSRIAFQGAPYEHVFFVATRRRPERWCRRSSTFICGARDSICFFRCAARDHWRVVGIVPPALRGKHDLGFDRRVPSVRKEAGSGLSFRKCSWFSTYRIHHRRAERFRDRRCFLLATRRTSTPRRRARHEHRLAGCVQPGLEAGPRRLRSRGRGACSTPTRRRAGDLRCELPGRWRDRRNRVDDAAGRPSPVFPPGGAACPITIRLNRVSSSLRKRIFRRAIRHELDAAARKKTIAGARRCARQAASVATRALGIADTDLGDGAKRELSYSRSKPSAKAAILVATACRNSPASATIGETTSEKSPPARAEQPLGDRDALVLVGVEQPAAPRLRRRRGPASRPGCTHPASRCSCLRADRAVECRGRPAGSSAVAKALGAPVMECGRWRTSCISETSRPEPASSPEDHVAEAQVVFAAQRRARSDHPPNVVRAAHRKKQMESLAPQINV